MTKISIGELENLRTYENKRDTGISYDMYMKGVNIGTLVKCDDGGVDFTFLSKEFAVAYGEAKNREVELRNASPWHRDTDSECN
jgi:hypothetical protein